MLFYLLLALASLVVIAFAWLLYWKTGSIAFPVGFAVFYFWSIHGGWGIVTDLAGGESGKRYHYLFDKVAPVYLDSVYMSSLVLYITFITTVGLAVYCTTNRHRGKLVPSAHPVALCHKTLIFCCMAAGLLSYLFVHTELATAALDGISGYQALSISEDKFYTLQKLLVRMAVLSLSIGIAVYASGKCGRHFVGPRKPTLPFWYAVVAVALTLMCFLKGQKNELFHALLTGTLVYLHNAERPKIWRLFLCGFLVFGVIAYIDSTRGYAIHELSNEISWEGFMHSYERILASNEAYAAHISMNAVQATEVELTYGSSLWSLAASFVPRIFWPGRPDDIYAHYAREVDVVEGQGYVIHHATGWYLNFGVIGVLMGGALLGVVWGKLYNRFIQKSRRPMSLTGRLFSAIAFLGFTGGMQFLIRGGPESYKSMVLNCLLAPLLILLISATAQRSRDKLRHRRQKNSMIIRTLSRQKLPRLRST